jgi:hypothetical protein
MWAYLWKLKAQTQVEETRGVLLSVCRRSTDTTEDNGTVLWHHCGFATTKLITLLQPLFPGILFKAQPIEKPSLFLEH